MKKLQVLLLLVVAGLALAPGAAGAGTTTRVSVSTTEAEANGASGGSALTFSGRFVAFTSAASNLHADDAETALDVFMRDRSNGTTTLIIRAGGAAGVNANGASHGATIDDDGGSISWQSSATNLDAADVDATFDIYRRDQVGANTLLISRATGAGGAKGNNISANPDINGSG